MQIVEKIGNYKKDNGITILQVKPLGRDTKQAYSFMPKRIETESEFAEKLLELIHSESIRKQTEIMNKGQEGQAQEKLTHA